MHWLGITQTDFAGVGRITTSVPLLLPFLSWLPAESATQQPVPAIDTDATASKADRTNILPDLVLSWYRNLAATRVRQLNEL